MNLTDSMTQKKRAVRCRETIFQESIIKNKGL